MAKKKGLIENTVGKVVEGAVKGVDNLLDVIVSPFSEESKKNKPVKKSTPKNTQKTTKTKKPSTNTTTKTTVSKTITIKQTTTTTTKNAGSKKTMTKKK